MPLPDFDALLKQRIGLDAQSIGSASLRHVLRERQRSCGLDSLEAYWNRVQSDEEELKTLIEHVVVPETWFFRHAEAFSAMIRLLSTRCSPGGDCLRLLSLPCATGEEPASIVMALLDAGYERGRFHVDAMDISEQGLNLARNGRYGDNAFRGQSGQWQWKYFEPLNGGYQLKSTVRDCIAYRQGNLLNGDLPEQLDRYDVIFCRNLLIYFDRPTQLTAIAALDALLKPDGLLFVGPAESALLLNLGWRSQRLPHAFAFGKPQAREAVAPVPPFQHHGKTVARPAMRPVVTAASTGVSVTPPVPLQRPDQLHDAGSILQRAKILADAGELAKAAQLCQQYLKSGKPVAEAYYLLGLVNDASARSDIAESHYRKALYLDPQHDEALVHLAVLLDSRGDRVGAARLQSRARRIYHERRGASDA